MQGTATIYLPAYDNDGESTDRIRAFCERKLVLAFGGYTSYGGLGSWLDASGRIVEETVVKYEITHGDWTKERCDILRKVARAFSIDSGKEFVLLVFPNSIENIGSDWTPSEPVFVQDM